MNKFTLIDFMIFSLAAYRLTHLLVFDKIFEPVRNCFVTRDFTGKTPTFTLQGGRLRSFIGRMLICHWCAGIWVSFGMAAAWWAIGSVMEWAFLALAAAAVLSLIETHWTKAVGYPELAERKRDGDKNASK
ncbi:DUF1360 domain-containing protein [Paenibacillus sp. MBLB4367]|uniref:DUF1360 domain-containing protein n=1 Tax=Paenibacillus sp. MBLB4367 TaxID=3384767 RepID=UPI00390834A7